MSRWDVGPRNRSQRGTIPHREGCKRKLKQKARESACSATKKNIHETIILYVQPFSFFFFALFIHVCSISRRSFYLSLLPLRSRALIILPFRHFYFNATTSFFRLEMQAESTNRRSSRKKHAREDSMRVRAYQEAQLSRHRILYTQIYDTTFLLLDLTAAKCFVSRIPPLVAIPRLVASFVTPTWCAINYTIE